MNGSRPQRSSLFNSVLRLTLSTIVATALAVGIAGLGRADDGALKWTMIDDGDPRERNYHDMAYDSTRNRIVMFGGRSEGSAYDFDDTWEFDGVDWIKKRPATHPGPRAGHAMAYMESKGWTVLFGGTQLGTQLLDETWVYDGLRWEQLAPPVSPSPRKYAAMTYDSVRDRIVLFGGGGPFNSSNFNDTWEFDGQTWYEVATANAPAPRRNHDMTYDTVGSRVVLYGGYDPSTSSYYQDTWEYDGANWVQLATQGSPVSIRSRSLSYDSNNNLFFIHDGDSTWQLDSLQWSQVATTEWNGMEWNGMEWNGMEWNGMEWNGMEWNGMEWNGMAVTRRRNIPTTVYMGSIGRTVMFSGSNVDTNFSRRDTWTFDGQVWSEIQTTQGPVGRFDYSATYDPLREVLLVYGGQQLGVVYRATWEFDGVSWSQAQPNGPTQPASHLGSIVEFDIVEEAAILFGGGYSPPENDRTWLYDATEWTELFPSTAPPARRRHASAYNPERETIMVFGGLDDHNQPLADTWEFNGSTWLSVSSADGPTASDWAEMVWDPGSARVLLFLLVSGAEMGETWAFQGTTWTAIPTSETPLCSGGFALEFLPPAGKAVFFGGKGGCSPEDCARGETWLFDGTAWKRLNYRVAPDDRVDMQLVWFFALNRAFLWGGRSESTNMSLDSPFNDLWAFGPPDFDGDAVLDAQDNCTKVRNGDQVDADSDQTGDACDCAPNDPSSRFPGEVQGVRFTDQNTLVWDPEDFATSYHLYRGRLEFLRTYEIYTQADHAVPGAAEECFLSGEQFYDAEDPAEDFFYLVSATNECGEGPLGMTSNSWLRKAELACED